MVFVGRLVESVSPSPPEIQSLPAPPILIIQHILGVHKNASWYRPEPLLF